MQKQKKILFLHGFYASGSCVPALALKEAFEKRATVLTPHLHIGTDKPEGPRSHLSRTAMLALAVTIHNLPEGMAVGVVFAGADSGLSGLSLTSALAVSIGIAIQNVPEGAIISMPMRATGNSKWRSFFIGSLSGAVEPIGGLAIILLASLMSCSLMVKSCLPSALGDLY